MPTDEVTDADREAAAAYYEDRHPTDMTLPEVMREGRADSSKTVQAFAAHRTASEQRGYDRAIAEVVAWLRGGGPEPKYTMDLHDADDIANAIEAGEHKP